MTKKPLPEPYRVLFPVGILLAVLGVLPWIFYDLGWLSAYPSASHSRIMILGFLMSFVSGFLMTAAPKMSGSKAASSFEISSAVILIFLQATLALSQMLVPAALVGSLQFLFLAAFLITRLRQRTQNPPSSFVFVPMGLLLGFLGSLSFLFQESLTPALFNFGKILLYQGLILNLIVGLGGRLIPVLSRIPGALDPTQKAASHWRRHLGTLLLLNFSFVAEAFLDQRFGLLIRFLVLSFVLIVQFRFFKKPFEKTWLRFCLRVASAFMIFPYLLMILWPALSLSFLHIVFISSFSLITLMVAVRVTLAHGGYDLAFEKNSRALPALTALLTVAMLLRSLAPLLAPQLLLQLIVAATVIWILALGFWAFLFWPKMFGHAPSKC